MGKGRKRFTRDLLDSAKDIIRRYITPIDEAQMQRTLSLVGVVGLKPHINDVMPQIMERIEEEEHMANIEMARRWARGGWSGSMVYDCMGEEDYLADEIDLWDKKKLRKLNKKLYSEKSNKRGSRGKGKGRKRYDEVDYTHYQEDIDDFWENRDTMYDHDILDDEDCYEEGYKSIKFYPDIENELSAIEFHSIKEFNDFCDKKGYVMNQLDIDNVKNYNVVHCCLDPIDLADGDYVVITDKSYGALYWTVSEDFDTDKVPASSNKLIDKN